LLHPIDSRNKYDKYKNKQLKNCDWKERKLETEKRLYHRFAMSIVLNSFAAI